ncbi:MAG: hypothetical protein KAH93_05335 [Candidatus Aenigmarchaeota archaeon]|nr:hypothetical protein [Candidatus Aenigmarchaeota archaeon]
MDTEINTLLTPSELIEVISDLEKNTKQIRNTPIKYKAPITPEQFIDKYSLVDETNAIGFNALEYAARIYAQIKGEECAGNIIKNNEQQILEFIGNGGPDISKSIKTDLRKALRQFGNTLQFMDDEKLDNQIPHILHEILINLVRDSLPMVSEPLAGEYRIDSIKQLVRTLKVSVDDITSDSKIPTISYTGNDYRLDKETRGVSELDMALMTAIYTHFKRKSEDEQKERYKKIEDISFLPEVYEDTLISLVNVVCGVMDEDIKQLSDRYRKLEADKKEVDKSIEKWRGWHIGKYPAQITDAIKSKEEELNNELLPSPLLNGLSKVIEGMDISESDLRYIEVGFKDTYGEYRETEFYNSLLSLRKEQKVLSGCANLKGNIGLARLYNSLDAKKSEIETYVKSDDFYEMPEIQPKKRAQDRIQSMMAQTKSMMDQLETHKKYLSRHS